MKLARALFLGKTELKLVASLGKIGYLLPEAARSAFFNKVLKKEFDELEGDNPRLDPEPWRQWTRAPGGHRPRSVGTLAEGG